MSKKATAYVYTRTAARGPPALAAPRVGMPAPQTNPHASSMHLQDELLCRLWLQLRYKLRLTAMHECISFNYLLSPVRTLEKAMWDTQGSMQQILLQQHPSGPCVAC
jgi:hypothetical protein